MSNHRPLLTKILEKAWAGTLRKHYDIGGMSPDINSEAALEAAFYCELIHCLAKAEKSGKLPGKNRVFVQPKLNGTSIIPDLIICRNARVIAVLELKYKPRLKTLDREFQKDLVNLGRLHKLTSADRKSQSGREIQFFHERYLGQFSKTKGERILFAKRPLYVWAGIYSSEVEKPIRNSLKEIFKATEHFDVPLLELHTIAAKNVPSKTESFFSGPMPTAA